MSEPAESDGQPALVEEIEITESASDSIETESILELDVKENHPPKSLPMHPKTPAR